MNRWERINVIAADDNNGGNAIEELRKAVERMPKEFQEYINVSIDSRILLLSHQQIGSAIRYPARVTLPLEDSYREQIDSALENMKKTANRVSIL